jgi:hypothetical protein
VKIVCCSSASADYWRSCRGSTAGCCTSITSCSAAVICFRLRARAISRGIVAKWARGTYQTDGRMTSWLKVKKSRSQPGRRTLRTVGNPASSVIFTPSHKQQSTAGTPARLSRRVRRLHAAPGQPRVASRAIQIVRLGPHDPDPHELSDLPRRTRMAVVYPMSEMLLQWTVAWYRPGEWFLLYAGAGVRCCTCVIGKRVKVLPGKEMSPWWRQSRLIASARETSVLGCFPRMSPTTMPVRIVQRHRVRVGLIIAHLFK